MHNSDKSKSEIENSGNGRYANIPFNRCGNSGVLLPTISLGLWYNFSQFYDIDNAIIILTLHLI
jgi:L-glyceraldehyde 3-phosphate reductase